MSNGQVIDGAPGTISKGDANRMIYKNFDQHITRKHGIIVEGWPLHTFDNPSAIGSQVELNILLRAWQTGATRFRRMTADEHMAWVESHANSEIPPIAAVNLPPAVPSSEVPNEDPTPVPPTDFAMFQTSFNIIPLESSATPQAGNPVPKKTRKVRSDKGKPRKKTSQAPGTSTFHASTQ